MCPDHLFEADIRILMNNGSPIIGRVAKTGLGFLSSTIGFPFPGLIGSLNQTTTPQICAPHLLTRTFASPACVSQMPDGSPVCARTPDAASSAMKTEARKASLVMRESPR